MSENPAGTAALPSAWYLEADAFMRERLTIFAEAWQMIARKAALAAAGDYVCNNLAGLAVFAMRSEAGTIRAHLNVCRHQGLPVLDAGRGCSALLRCRYHGWTYNFDGSFKGAPDKYAPAEPSSAANGLRTLPLAEWRGLLFVRASESGPALADAMTPLEPALDEAGKQPTALAAELTTDFPCNWKVLAEQWLASRAAGTRGPDGTTWLWSFPTLALEAGDGTLVVHQVVPRTHERTRVTSHVLADDRAAGERLAAAVERALAADKAAAEARQAAAAESGAIAAIPAAPGSAVARFRARIAAAHATSTTS